MDEDLKYLFILNKLCISRNGNYEYCQSVEYIENNDSYICSRCDSDDYTLDKKANKCYYNDKEKIFDYNYNCYIENIGNDLNPIYSCSKCYESYLPVIIENNVTICILKNYELRYCNESYSDTYYIKPAYNCISCSNYFLPYYSQFFERKICQDVFGDIITEKNISLEQFENVENFPALNDFCDNYNYFTPDGENCYSCNDKNVGMIGCNGKCSFSLKRNNSLKCLNTCKEGYIEISEGICEKCDSVEYGCDLCHYEDHYPSNYLGIKRKRNFVCDSCKDGLNKLTNGKCSSCMNYGLYGCEECEISNTKYICKKCIEGYYLNNGDCHYCNLYNLFINNNTCISCDNFDEGGIDGCLYCEKRDSKVICQICNEGYILMKNNYTCLKISENIDLQKFENCEQLDFDNNKKLYCSKCKQGFSLLKENNEEKCIYIPILYELNYTDFQNYFDSYFSYLYNKYPYTLYNNYDDDDYYYYQKYPNYPCQEAINVGTLEKPIYSCTKCYQYFEFDKSYEIEFTNIITEKNNVSYCVFQSKTKLYDCLEAIIKTKNGTEKYDCIKCNKNYKLIYNKDDEIHYCQYDNTYNKCKVKYCNTCQNNNLYFCSECLLSNYEVNRITGSCVKKAKKVPAITWKDIFGLQINSNKTINEQIIYGPLIRLRGITTSEINMRHAFLIYLIFKLKIEGNIRNLNDIITIPTFCVVEDEVAESYDYVNIVDYECIGNYTDNEDLNNYELYNIKEENNTGLLKSSNLEDLFRNIYLNDSVNKNESDYTINDLVNIIIIFIIDEINNQTTKNYIFDFKINGNISKQINATSIKTQLEMNEIDKKANCIFVIEDNQNASLSCKLNIEQHKEIKYFSFKTLEIETDYNYTIYLSKLDEIFLINNGENIYDTKKKGGKNNKKIVILIVSVIGGVIILVGLSLIFNLLSKKKKLLNETKEIDNTNNLAISTDNINRFGDTISKTEEFK